MISNCLKESFVKRHGSYESGIIYMILDFLYGHDREQYGRCMEIVLSCDYDLSIAPKRLMYCSTLNTKILYNLKFDRMHHKRHIKKVKIISDDEFEIQDIFGDSITFVKDHVYYDYDRQFMKKFEMMWNFFTDI